MTCEDLAAAIQRLQPQAAPREVARLCLLLANFVDDFEALKSDERLQAAWKETGLRLQAASDQHAAMSSELETLAEANLATLGENEVTVLLRAIKVQSQILQLYLGCPAS